MFLDLLAALFTSAVCGSAIGAEREFHHRPAGLRTNTLICMGAALFTLISIYLGAPAEKTRIASTIVSGIGFIGAGAILRRRQDFVVGLTSAATVWMSAAIGMLAGSLHPILAIIATACALAVLILLRMVEQAINEADRTHEIEILGEPGRAGLQELVQFIAESMNAEVIYLGAASTAGQTDALKLIYVSRRSVHGRLQEHLATLPGILEIKELHTLPDYKY